MSFTQASLKQSIKKFAKAMTGVEPEGNNLTDILRSFGTTLTGQQIVGRGIVDILDDISSKYKPVKTKAKKVEQEQSDN